MGSLIVEESSVKSKSPSVDISLIIEANSMDVLRIGTYPILLGSWEGAEHRPIDRIGIGYLVVEVSGVESESTSKSPSPYYWVTP